ncbi:MAG: ribonuclease PH [Alphaproteobacteria bacterium]|uniref:Ribonuclease PH n=1 Tax=Candidatus Bodocaedibacter vickermanii TaxID=2741701 RepID=A0A7L9RUL3_9PROT|nr:ribonuclease PH [Alphaproteobacteria bacterium]QOL20115.1 Ribonuclease PH [Candidatus Paracaedibacteraceae bacterium 'Lake Konstanz']
MRKNDRSEKALRTVSIEPGFSLHAEGSCLITVGNTKVICTASVDEKVPPFLRNTGKGWVTAEYGMLPRSTGSRMDREAARGGQSGRTHEIQRLIGRSLRAVIDLTALGERQIKVDCDVIQADGGTRTAAITGGFVALYFACKHLVDQKLIKTLPIKDHVAAISAGVVKGQSVLDLDYDEDSTAETDANFVMTGKGGIVEIQSTAEGEPFQLEQFQSMFDLAKSGINDLIKLQMKVMYPELS